MKNLTTRPHTDRCPPWCVVPRCAGGTHVAQDITIPVVIHGDATATLGAHQADDDDLWMWPSLIAELVQRGDCTMPTVEIGINAVNVGDETSITIDNAERLAHTLLAFVAQARQSDAA